MQRALNAKLTYDDYAAIPSDGKIYQIMDGDVYVTPSPSPQHQRASKRLQRQLEEYFEASGRAEVFNAPIDVILGDHDVSQPDLVVAAASSVTKRGIEAPPILIVEVLSPSTENFDRQVKAQRFAKLGVPNYWILDPQSHRLECYRNDGGTYVLSVEAQQARVPISDFPGLTIDLPSLWR
jgi:Uma2 family endonuclease